MKTASSLETLQFVYRSRQHHILVDRVTNCAVYTGLFKMIVGVLTTCHTQYT